MAGRSVSFDVLAIDKASKALGQVAREVTELDRRIDGAGGSIEVDAETAKATEKLRAIDSQLARLNAKSIKVDADTQQAQRQLQVLRAELERTTDEGKRVEIEADISQVQAQLRRLQAEKVSIDVDTAGAQAKVATLKAGIDGIDRRKTTTVDVDAAGAFGALARIGTQLRAVQTPVTISVGFSAVMNALAWVQRLAAGLTSLGAVGAVAGGVAIASFKGIGDAVQAMGEKAETGGGAVTASASAIRSATRQVEQAQRDLRDANANVTRSEETLAEAQEDARRAVESLDDARRAAIRTLQDYELRTAGMALTQESADLAIAEARQRLAEVEADGESSALQRARAELSVREAIQRRNEIEVEGKRLVEDKAAADAKGVEQSDQVVSAQDRIREANKRVEDAQAGLQKSHEEVSLAVQRLSDSQLALREAMKPSGGGTAVDKLAEDMAKLSPKGREFVVFLRGLLDGELKELQHTSADAFLPGLQDGIQAAMDNLGTFKESIAGVGASFGDFFRDIGPSVGRAVEALARLANLGAETTFEGLADAVNRTLDSFTKWANSQSAAKIQADIREIGQTIVDLKNDTLTVVRIIQAAWDLISFPADVAQSFVTMFTEPRQAVEDFYNAIRNVAQHIPGLRDQFPELGSAATTAATPITGVGTAASGAATNIDRMQRAAQRAVAQFASQEQANITYAASVDRAKQAVEQNGATLNLHTEKGRANRQALLDMASAANGVTEKMQASKAPAAQVTATFEAQRQKLIQQAQQFGLTKAQATAYVDKLLETPTAKGTTVTAQTATATANIKSVQTDLSNVKDKTVNIKGNNSGIKSAIDAVSGWLSNLRDKTINIIANKIGFSSGGWVPGGGPSNVDSVEARLAPGEFVVRSSQAARWAPLLEQINSGAMPGAATGSVGPRGGIGLAGGAVGAIGSPIIVHVNVTNAVVGNNDEIARVVSVAAREGIERGYLPRGVLQGG